MGRKKKNLEYLRTLIHRLPAAEIKSLKQYLRCFDPNFADEHRVKTLILLEALEKNKGSVSEELIYSKVYSPSENGNLKYLRLRLLNKIYESLLLEVNVERKGLYTEHARANIEVRKKLIQAQILWGRNITDELMVLLQQIIRKSTKYELYPELLEALYLKQQYQGFRDGLKVYMNIQTQIEKYEEVLRSLRKAKHYYTQIVLQGASRAGNPNRPDFISHARIELELAYAKTGSPSIGYYFFMISLEYFQQQEDFDSGAQMCAELIRLMESQPVIFTRRRMGITYGQFANNELFRHEFERSIEQAQHSASFFKAGSINHNMAAEIEFFGHYYLQDYSRAVKTLSPLVENAKANQTESQFQRRSFLYAACLFQLKKYRKAEPWLQHTSLILTDKKGWNIGIRLLNILIQMELERYDEIDLAVDALRKHITNLQKQDSLSPRYLKILKILNRIRTSNYDYSKALKASKEELAYLESGEDNCVWEVKGPEMIKFHDWFRNKAKERDRFTRV